MAQWAGCSDTNIWSQDFFSSLLWQIMIILFTTMIIKMCLMYKNLSFVWVKDHKIRYYLGSSKRNPAQEKGGVIQRLRGVPQNSLAENGSCLPWPATRNLRVGNRCFSAHPPNSFWRVSHFCSLLHICLILIFASRQIFLGFLPGFTWCAFSRIQQADQFLCLHSNAWEKLHVWPNQSQALSLPHVQIAVPRRDEGPII